MRHILILLTFLLAATPLSAQTGDAELDRLVGIAAMLRTADATVYGRALQMLQADAKWTPMDELGRVQQSECTPADKAPRFRLNRLLARADGSRKLVASRGDFLNGEDERFNYSLYERTLRARSRATYRIKGRQGRQTIVLVPMAAEGHGLTLRATAPGCAFKLQRTLPSGAMVYTSATPLRKEQQLTLTVTNASGTPQSFVLVNHNPRQ